MGTWNIFLEDIHCMKCCKKILFLSDSHGGPLYTDLNQKNSQKWPLFKTIGGCRFFVDFFKKIFSCSKCKIVIPQKVWMLYISYFAIFSILNDRHNQQKFQIFQKFRIFFKKKTNGIFVDYDGGLKLKISPNMTDIVSKLFRG